MVQSNLQALKTAKVLERKLLQDHDSSDFPQLPSFTDNAPNTSQRGQMMSYMVLFPSLSVCSICQVAARCINISAAASVITHSTCN